MLTLIPILLQRASKRLHYSLCKLIVKIDITQDSKTLNTDASVSRLGVNPWYPVGCGPLGACRLGMLDLSVHRIMLRVHSLNSYSYLKLLTLNIILISVISNPYTLFPCATRGVNTLICGCRSRPRILLLCRHRRCEFCQNELVI